MAGHVGVNGTVFFWAGDSLVLQWTGDFYNQWQICLNLESECRETSLKKVRDKEERDFVRKRKAVFAAPFPWSPQLTGTVPQQVRIHPGTWEQMPCTSPCLAHGSGPPSRFLPVGVSWSVSVPCQFLIWLQYPKDRSFKRAFREQSVVRGRGMHTMNVHVCSCCKEHQLPVSIVCFQTP